MIGSAHAAALAAQTSANPRDGAFEIFGSGLVDLLRETALDRVHIWYISASRFS
jgi:hypothetical protein